MNKKALDRNEHLVVIVEIHRWDAFYNQSERFLNRPGKFVARKRVNITCSEEGEFYGGKFLFVDNGRQFQFFGIKVTPWIPSTFEAEWEV